jgi:glycosyltransferase involved in cell wall biosynthesis
MRTMRILLCSHWFYPSIGGVETISKILAEEFTRQGAAVTVVTGTPGPAMDASYAVVRQPGVRELRRLAQVHDVVYQNMISLRTLLPLLGMGRPVAVTHASWLRRSDGRRGWENRAKLLALRLCHNIAISRAIAAELPVRSEVIGNPFETGEFERLRATPRDRDVVFLGRLVSDKGCDLLLEALGRLKAKGLTPSLTVVGDGTELDRLRAMVERLRLGDQVEFAGALREGRGAVVARHRVMAIPSRWREPFGVVALEGIAAGCAIVASEQGGLPDAVGPCGLYFPNGDAAALADALERVLTEYGLQQRLASAGPEHLRQFQPERVGRRYLEFFHSIVNR